MIIHNHHISPYHQPDLSRIMSNDQHRSTWTIHINHQWKERHRWLYDDVPCERCTQMTQHRRHGSLSIRSRKRFPSIARCPPASCYERSLLHSYSRCALHWCVLILERYGTYCMPQQTQSRVDRFCSKKTHKRDLGFLQLCFYQDACDLEFENKRLRHALEEQARFIVQHGASWLHSFRHFYAHLGRSDHVWSLFYLIVVEWTSWLEIEMWMGKGRERLKERERERERERKNVRGKERMWEGKKECERESGKKDREKMKKDGKPYLLLEHTWKWWKWFKRLRQRGSYKLSNSFQ